MEKFLFDLNDILARNLGIVPNNIFVLVIGCIYAIIGIVALFLALRSLIKLLSKKPQPIHAPKPLPEAPKPKEINVEVGEFGKIISDKKMLIKGQEIEYFTIKENKSDTGTLPVGTIVVVIKKNAKEAYVKPADEKDAAKFRHLL